jgi:dethiobiotin synthetase
MSGLFITGSGTGVGKTLVTCILLHQLRRVGRVARALKPVITGFQMETVTESDTGRLLSAMDEPLDKAAVGSISPWRFVEPLSPDMAAARESRRLDVGEIVGFCRYAGPAESGAIMLIEGVGGAMVPLSEGETVLDWMAALQWPVLVVVGSYLGTLSHTLTAVEAIRLRGLELAGIVVSESAESPVLPAETAETIGRFVGPAPVIVLPRIDSKTLQDGTVPDIAGHLGLLSPDSVA